MKKGGCFENLIGKASVFFAFLCIGTLMTGCQKVTDSISSYLQENSFQKTELTEEDASGEDSALGEGFDFEGFSDTVKETDARIKGISDSESENGSNLSESEDESNLSGSDEADGIDVKNENNADHDTAESSIGSRDSADYDDDGADADGIDSLTFGADKNSADKKDTTDKNTAAAKDTQEKNNGREKGTTERNNSGRKATDSSDTENTETGSSDIRNKEAGSRDDSDINEQDASGSSSTFDPVKVNKAIDDLISKIEKETGRAGRRRTVEETEETEEQEGRQYFSDTYQEAQRASLGLSVVDIEDLKKSQAGNYAFEHLTDEGKTVYVELLQIIRHKASDVVVSTLDEDVLDVVCQFVQADHPELFYIDGYTYTRYTIGGVLKRISFSGKYLYDADEIAERQAKIDAYVDECLSGIPRDADTFAKVKYVYDYLITNTEYDADAPDNQNICSVFIYGRSVCQGYAEATQYLLNKLGIPATVVTGKVNGVGHTWNLVRVDGEYTYVDTTWGDSSYQMSEAAEGDSQKLPFINYTYLCCTTQDIEKTHVIAETLPVPECTSMKNNYYVREGEYFTECDMDALAALFRKRYADGSNNVTIKCSTKAIYDEFNDVLFDGKKVFSLMEGTNTTVSYSRFEKQYILVIWLY
ncbi:transglutaminase domain-containing protein [Butyrivibrio sp. WCE2006]|uniref:transglutaminase domain-containing protein n=1 Tax=Butyrivibrio sp. WCE2006 TaxID=1410611 RepID=UPI00067922C2|nr:transglutaminase domain-containing protein [Butyrivibrio sp. WCE2006]